MTTATPPYETWLARVCQELDPHYDVLPADSVTQSWFRGGMTVREARLSVQRARPTAHERSKLLATATAPEPEEITFNLNYGGGRKEKLTVAK